MIQNFGRTWRFEPRRVVFPEDAAAVAAIVRQSAQLRVMGARHSWSRAIVTDDTVMSLDRQDRVLAIDHEAMTVRVQAGIRLKDLVRQLAREGLALANLGSIAEQSVAGAMATGTHGTGLGFRCLADQAVALQLVDGTGAVREIARDHPDFDAAAVSLGCLGVVTEVTLRVVPRFQMHFVTEARPFDEVIERFDELASGHDHFKIWWLAPCDDVIVFRQRRTDEPRNDSTLRRWLFDELLAVGVYRAAVVVERLHRQRLVPAVNRALVRTYARPYDRICDSPVAFLTPSPPVHREGEWAFDYADAQDLLRAYRAMLLADPHQYSFLQEIRLSRGDDFWLSPATGRDTLWLSLYNIDEDEAWADQRARMEAFARERGGRPHWGKEARFDRDAIATHYPRLADFRGLMGRYDPARRFLNPWARRALGIGPAR